MESVTAVADSYSNLEYDLKKGARGLRHDHVEKIIAKITGAEAAMVVNNNAAATMLCLSAMAFGKEVITSRAVSYTHLIAGGFDGSLQADGSIIAELQVITGATNEMGFNPLSAR